MSLKPGLEAKSGTGSWTRRRSPMENYSGQALLVRRSGQAKENRVQGWMDSPTGTEAERLQLRRMGFTIRRVTLFRFTTTIGKLPFGRIDRRR